MNGGKFKNRNNEYSEKAKNFCRKTGTTITVVYDDSVTSAQAWGDKHFHFPQMMHDKYKVTIKRGHKQFRIDYYGSNHDYERNLRPDAYDILSCLSGDFFEGTIDDFVREFGYEVDEWDDVRRIEKIYKGVCRETRNIRRLYSEDEIEMLLDIR